MSDQAKDENLESLLDEAIGGFEEACKSDQPRRKDFWAVNCII